MNYEKDVEIDETALDVEWLQQPRLMLKYGNYAAQKRQEMDLAKENLDVVKAQLDKDIRAIPGDYGIGKLTESAIQSAILTQEEYQEANQAYIKAKYEYDMAITAVRAIDQKKTALENLVRLYGQQYFAGPKVPRDLSKEWVQKERQKKVDKGVAKSMKRKKK